jgi:hypothetical protein
MGKVSTRSSVYMRSQGILTGQGFSISDNEISLLNQENKTLVMKYKKRITLFTVRIIGNFVISVNLNKWYLGTHDLG